MNWQLDAGTLPQPAIALGIAALVASRGLVVPFAPVSRELARLSAHANPWRRTSNTLACPRPTTYMVSTATSAGHTRGASTTMSIRRHCCDGTRRTADKGADSNGSLHYKQTAGQAAPCWLCWGIFVTSQPHAATFLSPSLLARLACTLASGHRDMCLCQWHRGIVMAFLRRCKKRGRDRLCRPQWQHHATTQYGRGRHAAPTALWQNLPLSATATATTE